MIRAPWNRRIAAVASLGDENRRKLFDFVASAGCAVSRDDAARALGLPRSTASFQLDRLVHDGLLAVEFRKLGGRGGPGSGPPGQAVSGRRPGSRGLSTGPELRSGRGAAGLGHRGVNGRRRFRARRAACARPARAGRPQPGPRAGRQGRRIPSDSSGSSFRRVPRRGGLPAGGRRRGWPGAAQLSLPPDRRRPHRRGLRHERRLPGRRRGRLRHRPGPDAGPRHRRPSRAGSRAAGAVLRPDRAPRNPRSHRTRPGTPRPRRQRSCRGGRCGPGLPGVSRSAAPLRSPGCRPRPGQG